jgi:hypothetical protein
VIAHQHDVLVGGGNVQKALELGGVDIDVCHIS